MAQKIADVIQVNQTLPHTKTQRSVPLFSPACVCKVHCVKNSEASLLDFIA